MQSKSSAAVGEYVDTLEEVPLAAVERQFEQPLERLQS